jgi:hypothetical protein
MRQNLIKKPVLGIEMASFCEELKKDIIESPTKGLTCEHQKNSSCNKYLYILYIV